MRVAHLGCNLLCRSRNFFMGVPAPAGAFLVCAPMVLEFRFSDSPYLDNKFVAPYFLFAAFMLVSDVPTFSSKMIHREMFRGVVRKVDAIATAAAAAYCVVTDLWLSYLAAVVAYVLSFAVSYVVFQAKAQQHRDAAHQVDLAALDPAIVENDGIDLVADDFAQDANEDAALDSSIVEMIVRRRKTRRGREF